MVSFPREVAAGLKGRGLGVKGGVGLWGLGWGERRKRGVRLGLNGKCEVRTGLVLV